jgi:cell division protease FtsH
VPRGRSLGVTVQSPLTDRYGYGAEYLHGRIVGLLGGRAAEQLVYGDVTTGAESDLEQVTLIARQMVGRWGMSKAVGLVSILPADDEVVIHPGELASEATRQLVDAEVRRIIDEGYDKAVSLLRSNRVKLDALTARLLAHESLDEADAYEAAGFPRGPEGGAAPASVARAAVTASAIRRVGRSA